MSHTSRLKRMPDTFRQLTGITPAAFDRRPAEPEPRYRPAEATHKARRTRRRKLGAERKFALPPADRLLMLLMYYRTYATHAFLRLPLRHQRQLRVPQRQPAPAPRPASSAPRSRKAG